MWNCGNEATAISTQTALQLWNIVLSKLSNFCTKERVDLNYHFVKKHTTPREEFAHKCKICFREFTGFYALRQHKTSQHIIQMKSPDFDVNNLFEDDNADPKEEFQACQHFLVDSELEKGKHRVFIFAMSTFDNSMINKKLDLVFNGLKCAAKVSLAFGFVLKNIENGSFRFFYAHENNTVWSGRNLCVHQTTLPV